MEEFSKELKKEYMQILKNMESVYTATTLTNRQLGMLIYFTQHKNDREFDFVPAKYKESK